MGLDEAFAPVVNKVIVGIKVDLDDEVFALVVHIVENLIVVKRALVFARMSGKWVVVVFAQYSSKQVVMILVDVRAVVVISYLSLPLNPKRM